MTSKKQEIKDKLRIAYGIQVLILVVKGNAKEIDLYYP
jgi:hypothetical protein